MDLIQKKLVEKYNFKQGKFVVVLCYNLKSHLKVEPRRFPVQVLVKFLPLWNILKIHHKYGLKPSSYKFEVVVS